VVATQTFQLKRAEDLYNDPGDNVSAQLRYYINIDILSRVKPLDFLGDSLDVLRAFPDGARRAAGFQLDRLQRGLEALDWKPMPSIGAGVQEIRVREEGGAFRVIYLARRRLSELMRTQR